MAVLLGGLFAAAPVIAGEDVFTVSGVRVDATAKDAAAAREQALAAGQQAALRRLLDRLTLAPDLDRLPGLGPDRVADLVESLEVADEKTSPVRYLATLRVHFKPEEVRAMLRARGIAFAETRSKPVLVLPVYEVAGALSLWETPNPWRAAWRALPPSDGLVPLIHPEGDLRDAATIGAEQAVRGDDERLAAIARRYGAADVLVAVASLHQAGPGAGGGAARTVLQVTISRLGTVLLEHTRIEAFTRQEDESRSDLFARAARAIAAQVEENWKRNNRLRFDTGDELTVAVPLSALSDWLEVRRRLAEVAFVRDSTLIYLSRKMARLRLKFIGDEDQLTLALAQSDLALERGATSWILRLGGAETQDAGGAGVSRNRAP